MGWYIGIDGGGTKTAFCLGKEEDFIRTDVKLYVGCIFVNIIVGGDNRADCVVF